MLTLIPSLIWFVMIARFLYCNSVACFLFLNFVGWFVHGLELVFVV